MTQHVLIGVGGSGQHVVHAYLRLLTLTSPQAKDVPHVFIVDADARLGSGSDKRSSLIDDIFDLHSFLVSDDETPPYCQVLKPFKTTSENDTSSPVLAQHIGVTENAGLAALANGFLADDNHEWGNDWNVELSKGMLANPKVGSITLAHKVEGIVGNQGVITGSSAEVREQFGQLFNVLREGTRVAIVGSNFGGTGSGVIPALVRQLDGQAGIDAVRAFMCLPWFSIESGETGGRTSAARSQSDVDPKERNSSLGLHTYLDELSGSGHAGGLKKSTYIFAQSMPNWPQEKRIDDGNFDQRENRHALNPVQASAVQAFLGLGKGGAPNGHLYSLKTTSEAETRGHFDAASSPHLRFWAGHDDSRQLIDLIADAEAAAFVLEKAGRVLENTKKGSLELKGVADLKDQPGIDRFLISLSESLSKGTVKYGLISKRETAPDDVFKQLGVAMVELSQQIRSSLVWMDGHAAARAGNDIRAACGVTGYTPAHLFGASDFGNSKQTFANIDTNDRLKSNWLSLSLVVTEPSGKSMVDSPVISQAFALFNDLFATNSKSGAGTDPVDALISQFGEARKVAKDQAGPTVAARVISKALYAKVIAARNENRKKESAADARQSSDSGGGSPMLSLEGLTGTPVSDCRLVEVKLSDESIGNTDEFSARHPLSLAYLDPYSGLQINHAGEISFSGYTFPEHGLKGIPNIAAPYLLQKWRISKCRPITDEAKSEVLFKDDNGRVRATKGGIYLHARRITEAAFWLIVSADRRTAFVDDLFNESNKRHVFARLLRKELGLTDNDRLPALVFAEGENAGKPIFMWSGETWYLAANSAARLFFANLVKDLPTVRNLYRTDNPLIRLGAENMARTKPLDRFFGQQLHKAMESLGGADGGTPGVEASTRSSIGHILSDILKELPPPSDEYAAPEGEPTRLWLRSSNNSNNELSVAPHKIVADQRALYCEPRVVFINNNQEPNGLLPIKAEAWDLLEGGEAENSLLLTSTGAAKVDESSLALRRVDQMRLKVKGLGNLDLDLPFDDKPLPVIQQELAWSLGVWPNFRAPGWNYYIISGTSRLGDPDIAEPSRKAKPRRVNMPWMKEGMEVALVIKGKLPGGKPNSNEKMPELGRITNGLPKRIMGVPEVMELHVGGKVLGSRRISLDDAQGRKSVDMIGIDFGTSNTCVAIQAEEYDPESRRTVPMLPGGVFEETPVEPMLLYLDSSGDPVVKHTFLSKAAGFFHVKNSRVNGDSGDTLPSELLVSLDDDIKGAARQKSILPQSFDKNDKAYAGVDGTDKIAFFGDYPVVSPLLTPLPPQPYGLENDEEFFRWLKGTVKTGDERLLGDLKWPRAGDDGGFLLSRSLRAIYLEHTLVVVLAILRARGYADFGKFVATQPEALSQVKNNFADTFSNDLNEIVLHLSQCTGMAWRGMASKPLLVSETVAALQMTGHTAENVSVLTIDVGGGTTDVGICLRYGNAGKAEKRFTASARFAGNKLLEALAHALSVRTFFQGSNAGGGEEYSPDALKSLLKSELRRKAGGGLRTDQTALLADMFFDGLYEYAFKVLHSFIQVNPDWVDNFVVDGEQTMKVVLLGNGFRLYDAFQVAGSGETLHRYNANLLKRLIAVKLLPESVAKKVGFEIPDTPKSGLISVGGLDAAMQNLLFEDEERFVLLSKGLTSSGTTGKRALTEPSLMALGEFSEDWLGLKKGSSKAANKVSVELSKEAMESEFPLTFGYWRDGTKNRTDDLQNVFQPSPVFATLYMDVGSLYLTGTPLGSSRSFSWLMTQYAKEGS